MSSRLRPALTLVEQPESRPASPSVSFCGHCGVRPAVANSQSRVCTSCGLGLLLEASADVAPAKGQAFLVIDASLSVCAVSRADEKLLANSEPTDVNRHLTGRDFPSVADDMTEDLPISDRW